MKEQIIQTINKELFSARLTTNRARWAFTKKDKTKQMISGTKL